MYGLKKNSKKPEVRRQELIDVASALFAEKGYEAVSVRDILNVVDGAPGMFYYYFKSKQDIYIAAMEQYITQRLERKCKIIEDETVSFDEKLPIFRSMVEEDIQGYMERFAPQADTSISDTSYKRKNRLNNRFHITEENVEAFATFVLYGAWGMIYNNKFTGNGGSFDLESILKITDQLFY